MVNLPFDPYAMVRPKTQQDISLLLHELLNELQYLNELLETLVDEEKND